MQETPAHREHIIMQAFLPTIAAVIAAGSVFLFSASTSPAAEVRAAVTAHAAIPSSERWRDAAEAIVLESDFIFMKIGVTVDDRPMAGGTPLESVYRGDHCEIAISTRGSDTLMLLSQYVQSPRDWDIIIKLAVVHEIAHCYVSAIGHPDMLRANSVVRSFTSLGLGESRSSPHSQKIEESFADISALLWIQQNHPEDYARAIDLMLAVRSMGGLDHSIHSGYGVIKKLGSGAAATEGTTIFIQSESLVLEYRGA